MPLVPDPCLVEKIKANNGATRLLVQVANGPEAFNTKITGLNKPNWVDVEGYHLAPIWWSSQVPACQWCSISTPATSSFRKTKPATKTSSPLNLKMANN